MKVLAPPSSGSIAGTVFSHNRAGQYTRNRRTPVIGTRTPRQGVVKGNMSASSKAWAVLTAAQQAAWASYANSHPIVDALGQSIKLTGHQYFVRISAALLNVGQPSPIMPPTSPAVVAEVILDFAVSAQGECFLARQVGADTDFVGIALAKYTSKGAYFQKTFHQTRSISADLVAISLSSDLIGWAGTPTLANRAWIRLSPVNQYGVSGTKLIQNTDVVAAMPLAGPALTSPAAGNAVFTFAVPAGPAVVLFELAPTSTGPWTYTLTSPSAASPITIAGQPSGRFARGALYDAAGNRFSSYSNILAIT